MSRLDEIVHRIIGKTNVIHSDSDNFDEVFTYSDVAKAIVTKDGFIARVNELLCKQIGKSEDKLVGLHFKEVTYPPDFHNDNREFQKLVSGVHDYYKLKKRYYNFKDGKKNKVFWAELQVWAVRKNGNFDFALGTFMPTKS